MDAKESVAYGIVDGVLELHPTQMNSESSSPKSMHSECTAVKQMEHN